MERSALKKWEWIFVVLVLVGAVLKVLHLPMASFLLIVGASSLAILYLVFAQQLFATPTLQDEDPLVTKLARFTLAIAVLGLLFKIQLWPLRGFYLLLARIVGPITIVIILMKQRYRPELRDYFNGVLRRVVPVTLMAVLMYFVSATTLRNHYYPNDLRTVELLDSLDHAPDAATEKRLMKALEQLDKDKRESSR